MNEVVAVAFVSNLWYGLLWLMILMILQRKDPEKGSLKRFRRSTEDAHSRQCVESEPMTLPGVFVQLG